MEKFSATRRFTCGLSRYCGIEIQVMRSLVLVRDLLIDGQAASVSQRPAHSRRRFLNLDVGKDRDARIAYRSARNQQRVVIVGGAHIHSAAQVIRSFQLGEECRRNSLPPEQRRYLRQTAAGVLVCRLRAAFPRWPRVRQPEPFWPWRHRRRNSGPVGFAEPGSAPPREPRNPATIHARIKQRRILITTTTGPPPYRAAAAECSGPDSCP